GCANLSATGTERSLPALPCKRRAARRLGDTRTRRQQSPSIPGPAIHGQTVAAAREHCHYARYRDGRQPRRTSASWACSTAAASRGTRPVGGVTGALRACARGGALLASMLHHHGHRDIRLRHNRGSTARPGIAPLTSPALVAGCLTGR